MESYLDKELANGNKTFANTEMDGEITLNDKITFYIKKSSGYLNIKFDKEKNSADAYANVRSILEKIGEVVR